MVRSHRCVLAAGFGIALGLGPAPAKALELSDLKIELENLGVDPDASGSLRLRLQEGQARFQIRLAGLDPSSDYGLVANGIERATLTTDGSGQLNVTLTQPSGDPSSELDFDPRGKLVAVNDGTDDVLAVEFSTAAATNRPKVYERTEIEPTADAQGGTAELSHKLLPNGKQRFSVRVKHVPVGDYDVCVGGVYRETLSTNAGGVGRVDFSSNPPKGQGSGNGVAKKVLITFDPYGDEVEIWSASETNPASPCDPSADPSILLLFSGPLLAQIPGINVCTPSPVSEVDLTGASGSGHATLEIEEDCRRSFEVTVDGLAAITTYDVDVDPSDGTVEGEGVIVTDGTGTGEVTFSSDPEAGQELLDFDPSGELVQVRPTTTSTVALSGTLP